MNEIDEIDEIGDRLNKVDISSKSYIKPVLKWVGGKTQIIEQVISQFPNNINNYYEPFVGGGSILIALLSSNRISVKGTINAYDKNASLIYLYKNIQTNHTELYNTLMEYINEYNSCEDTKENLNRKPTTIEEAKLSKENYYYWIRNNYNKLIKTEIDSVTVSSLFIFLNKTCFRGLYRTGPNGFNVPFGNYKNPSIIQKDNLIKFSKLIKNVNFEIRDFSIITDNLRENDFVYFDPPYAPENKNSFVGYTNDGFTLEHHNKLFNILHNMNEKKYKFVMSNAYVDIICDEFKNDKYSFNIILCKRTINSKNPGIKTKEVIIKNY
jgi:DNA adenine methylase